MERPKPVPSEDLLTEEDLEIIAEDNTPTGYSTEEVQDINQAIEDGRS